MCYRSILHPPPPCKSGINDPEKLLEGVLSQVTGYIEGGCKNEANVL